MGKTVCFTGHRKIPDMDYPQLYETLYQEVEKQILDGATVFRAGGALGFDTHAALCVLSMRKKYPQIRLELILPCPSQADKWEEGDRHSYERILEMADSHRYVSQSYHPRVWQARNRALVDGADVCIAYLGTSGGGTAYTVAYALKKGLELINLYDALYL